MHVHEDHTGARLANQLHGPWVAGEGSYIIDYGSAAFDRGAHDSGTAGVDRDKCPGFGERADDRRHASDLLRGSDWSRPWARQLAADVDDVGALIQHRHTARDRRGWVEGLAAIGEAVGRYLTTPITSVRVSGKPAKDRDRPLAAPSRRRRRSRWLLCISY